VLRRVGFRVFVSLLAFLILPVARSETPEQWVALLARVHGGFGAFLPVGTRVGEDAMKRLNAKPRELDVTFYQGEGTPCPCAADGVSLAVMRALVRARFISRRRNRRPAPLPLSSSSHARAVKV
jgi:hypothetical protein